MVSLSKSILMSWIAMNKGQTVKRSTFFLRHFHRGLPLLHPFLAISFVSTFKQFISFPTF